MMISVILPAYQEAENLKTILPKLKTVLEKAGTEFEILVVDTIKLTDNSKKICFQCGGGVFYLPRKGGNLYGDAIRTGFAQAKGEFVVVMDADGSHNPEDIIRFYDVMKSNDYNLVIGSRYCKGGYTDNNLILRFMSWILNLTYRILFQLKVKDVSDSFRMYRTADLKSLDFECNNFDIVEEILIKLQYSIPNFKIKEIPISFHKRAAGESKRDLLKFIRSYLVTMRRLLKIKHKLQKRNSLQ